MKIVLDEKQHYEALEIAERIRQFSVDICQPQFENSKSRNNHIRSVCSRYAFALVMGIEWKSSNLVAGHFVKHIYTPSAPMILTRRSHRQDLTYVLDIAPCELTHHFIGWIDGTEIQDGWLNENLRVAGYVVPRSALHPMDELPLPARRTEAA